MRKLLFIAVAIALVIACGGNDNPYTNKSKSTKKTSSTKKSKLDGEKIYKQYCTICHGVKGDMGASGAHDLTKSELTLAERIAVVTNGRKTMTPFKGTLSDAKIKAVAEYSITLKKD